MAATQAERNRASRLRAKLRAGNALSSDETRWLADYDGAPSSDPQPSPSPHVATHAPPVHDAPPPQHAPPASSSAAPDVLVDFGSPVTAIVPVAPTGPRCSIKDCPECAKAKGGERCGTTGAVVHPPMDMDAALGLADMVNGAIGLLARMIRSDGATPPRPNDADRTRMARALQLFLYRRAGGTGQYGDILMMIGALGTYGARAFRGKPDASPG
jgi:hypothetical protein